MRLLLPRIALLLLFIGNCQLNAFADFATVRKTAILYEAPSTKAPQLGQARKGQRLELLSPTQENGYYQVSFEGKTAYIFRTRVKVKKGKDAVSQLNIQVRYGLPSKDHVIYKNNYAVGFDPEHKIPRWTSHRLATEDLATGRDRKGSWKQDPAIPSDQQAQDRDYVNSGYARGHLVPSADMVRSAEAMQDTFVFINAAPQIQDGFNSGVWSALEDQARDWAKSEKEIWIISGVFFEQGEDEATKFIGAQKDIGVPTHFYKIVYDPEPEPRVLAFVYTNVTHTGHKFSEDGFRISVDDLEERTGLDFLAELEDKVQKKLEKGRDAVWGTQ